MDFEYCYKKNGYKEAREKLAEDSKAYLHGFEYCYEQIENFMNNTDCYTSIPNDVSPTLAKIDRELRENIINDLRHWLRLEWYEMIVCMIDNELTEKNPDMSGKIYQHWKTPEPLPDNRVEELSIIEE